jgi:pantothenate kinase
MSKTTTPIPYDDMDEFGKSPIRTFTNFIPSTFSEDDSQVFIIGVAGGSASGKSTVISKLKLKLGL